MADPLSIAGLVVGVVGFGLQTMETCSKYLDAIKCREQELASLRNDVIRFTELLQNLESLTVATDASHHKASKTIKACISDCHTHLKSFEELLNKVAKANHTSTGLAGKLKSQSLKMSYAFNKGDLLRLEGQLTKANTSLQTALQTLGLYEKVRPCPSK